MRVFLMLGCTVTGSPSVESKVSDDFSPDKWRLIMDVCDPLKVPHLWSN